ncbi:PIR Superfamily Protein [Plasmodium ovale wallikeri]|uniref:PIR Superfamily Protein n=1 Tax=Plasmodium ovale wallikeri TaxID=864142 RepID=A0A1A8ZTT0_PLAOA|nr:PIR Superfamily Protein [Plasmodium ovale wallikeri]SBT56652.1 PIR Superfamily Protein [Plasmodium ovale wallikeri]
MPDDINVDKLPSKIHYNVLKECMKYDKIDDFINNVERSTDANAWILNFNEYSSNYLDMYIDDTVNNPNKRCRDYLYLLEDIITKIKGSSLYENKDDNMLMNIDNYKKHTLMSKGYEECPVDSEDEESIYTNSRKRFDDFCEDITYINRNINEINSSSQCSEIKNYITAESTILKSSYDQSLDEYFHLLKYNKFTSFNEFSIIIEKVTCKKPEISSGEENLLQPHASPELSGVHISIPVIFSLLGILFFCIYLYKFTSFGPWLNRHIQKRKIIWNNLNDRFNEQILQEKYEISQKDSNISGYDMLYHSLSDS